MEYENLHPAVSNLTITVIKNSSFLFRTMAYITRVHQSSSSSPTQYEINILIFHYEVTCNKPRSMSQKVAHKSKTNEVLFISFSTFIASSESVNHVRHQPLVLMITFFWTSGKRILFCNYCKRCWKS